MMNIKHIKQKEKGFTLIELMIVVAIIGILAAIAIPQFAKYRVKAYNSAAESDLRNIMTAEEATYADSQAYVNDAGAQGAGSGVTSLPAALVGAKLSKNVTARINTDTNGSVYAAFTGHNKGDRAYGGDSTGTVAYKTATAPDTTASGQTETAVPSSYTAL